MVYGAVRMVGTPAFQQVWEAEVHAWGSVVGGGGWVCIVIVRLAAQHCSCGFGGDGRKR